MLKGLYLTLMIGPVIPIPVPQVVLDSLTDVSVTVAAGQPSGFQLTFTLSTHSPLHTLFLLSAAAPLPLLRVILMVTVNGVPDVLMDGVMTHHEVSPGSDPGHATLTVSGTDLTQAMDLIDFTGIPYPAMPPEARVLLILAKYAIFGMIPLVIPSLFPDISIPLERFARHEGTDLAYVQKLAEDAGYVFYLIPGPAPGVNIAYWGPEIKVGVPQPALNTNMDAQTNVESLSFQFNANAATTPLVFIQIQETHTPIPIPIPDINPLAPPLGLIPPNPLNVKFLTGTAKLNPIEAILAGLTEAAKTADAVTGSGSLNVLRYGRLLKARGLVGVRGVGLAYDGLYYVNSVTSRIKRGEIKQEFRLSRNGLVSITPLVPA